MLESGRVINSPLAVSGGGSFQPETSQPCIFTYKFLFICVYLGDKHTIIMIISLVAMVND